RFRTRLSKTTCLRYATLVLSYCTDTYALATSSSGVIAMVVPPSPLSPDSDLVTVEEFYCLVPDGQKADLIDGVIYMASPDTRRSDRLGGFIKFLMQGYAAVQG